MNMAEAVRIDPTLGDLGNMNYNYYVTLVSATVLIYDFILTFPAEVERFWFVGRLNWAICLFYLNRYFIIFGYVPVLMESFWVTHNPAKLQMSVPDCRAFSVDVNSFLLLVVNLYSCRNLQTYHECLSTAVQGIVAVMFTMRIYALYRRNVRVLVVFVAISSALLAISCWSGYGGYKNDVSQDILVPVGCGVTLSHDRAKRFAVSWAAMFLFDFLVFGLTVYRISSVYRSNNANVLITVFMRDGAMYFGIVTASALVNIVCLLLAEPLTRDVAVTLTNVISSVMMSRLMLNLRDPSLIPLSRRNTSEDISCPDLTIVESHYPTELSDRDIFAESESSQDHHSFETSEALDQPTGGEIELHRINV